MDKRKLEKAVRCGSMQTPRNRPFELLLQAYRAEPARTIPHETGRRNVYREALSRFQSDSTEIAQGRTFRESKTDSGAYAIDGVGRNSTGTQHVKESSRARQIPVSAAQSRYFLSSSRMEHRH